MIKCDVTVCAKITRAAVVKETSNGTKFLSFGIQLPIIGKNKEKVIMEIGVSADGDKSQKSVYSEGRRVNITGSLTMRAKDDKVFYNLRADNVDTCKSTESDNIEGTLYFKGKIDKRGIDVRQDKNGKDYKSFSAFSYEKEKDSDKTHFTYVRFLYFNPKENEDYLEAGAYIEASGQLQLGVFREKLSIDCRIDEVSHWEYEKKDK